MVEVTRDEMAVLVELQETETSRDRITTALQDMPRRLAQLDIQRQAVEERFQAAEAVVLEKRTRYKALELEVKNRQELIKKSDVKLFSIKNNKEYQAVLKEIDDLKRQSAKIEDQMLELLLSVETEDAALADAKKEHDGEKARIVEDQKRVAAERADLEQQLAELDVAAKDVQAKVTPKLLGAYQQVRKRVGGGAVLAVVKNYVCQGCFMNIPPQTYNELHRSTTLKYCPFCTRIIYYNGNSQE